MDLKSQIRAAYVAGLCPQQMLLQYKSDSHRPRLPAAIDQTPFELPRKPSRWRRALLLALILGLAIGTWQIVSHNDGARAVAATVDSASGESALPLGSILDLTIGAVELHSRADQTRAATDASGASAPGQDVLNA